MENKNKENDLKDNSLSGKDFFIVLAVIAVIGILWAILVSFVPQSTYVVFFLVMFGFVVVGPILYFRKRGGIWKGSFRFRKPDRKD